LIAIQYNGIVRPIISLSTNELKTKTPRGEGENTKKGRGLEKILEKI
jgi:hypothetical protein